MLTEQQRDKLIKLVKSEENYTGLCKIVDELLNLEVKEDSNFEIGEVALFHDNDNYRISPICIDNLSDVRRNAGKLKFSSGGTWWNNVKHITVWKKYTGKFISIPDDAIGLHFKDKNGRIFSVLDLKYLNDENIMEYSLWFRKGK